MSIRCTALVTGPLAIGLGLSANALAAQTDDAPTLLEPIYIQRGEEAALNSVEGYAAQAGSTALRGLAGDLRTTPRAVTVVTTEQINDQGAQTLEEAIAYVPGVTTQTFGQDGRYDQLAIRGFETNTVYRDGMPLRTFGWGAWRTELFGTERVEVLRGTTSDLYGANQPGGLVNAVTKRPEFTFGGELRAKLSGYGGGEIALDVTGPASDRLAYRFVGLLNSSGTIFDEVDQSRVYLAPSLTWKATEQTNITVFAQYQRDEVPDTYVTLPEYGTRLPNPVARYGNDFYPNDPDNNTIKTTQTYIGYELDHAFDNGLTLRSRARFARNDWLNTTSYASTFSSSSGVPDAVDTALMTDFDVDQRFDETSFDNALYYKFANGNVEGTVIGGIDYYKVDYNNSYGFTRNRLRNLLTGALTPIAETQALTEETQDIKQVGLYANGYLNVGTAWVVNLGVRRDRLSRNINRDTTLVGLLPTPIVLNAEEKTSEYFTSANLGVSYNFDNGITVYGNAARSFDLPPTGFDMDGNTFKVEKAKSYELGARFQPLGTNSLLGVALFQIEKSNTTQNVPGTPFVEQTGAVRARGVELEANYRFYNGLSVLAAYTYNDAKLRDDSQNRNNRLPRIPEHAASIWLSYDIAQVPGLRIAGGARYIGSRFSDDENTSEFELAAVTLVDASVSYQWGEWQAILAARNLGDKEYLTYCAGTPGAFSNGCNYGTGRTVELSLSRRF